MSRALASIVGGFFLGVAAGSLFSVHPFAVLAALLAAGVSVYVSGRTLPHGLYVVLVLCAAVVGVVRVELATEHFSRSLTLTEGSTIERLATVHGEPDVRETHTILTLALDRYPEDAGNIVVRARVPHYPAVAYGDRVTVRGTVRVPEPFNTDTGRVFDYRGYLMKEGVHYELAYANIAPRPETGGNAVTRMLVATKHAWLDAVSQTIPEPSASLVGGVVVGAKQSLGDAWLTAFRDTGIVHIIVLSGYNLTLVAVFIAWLTRPLSRAARLVAGIAGVCAFALMTGGGATVVRASIMAGIGMLALFLARPYAAVRALVVAAFLMVCINPFLLIHDTGFQLSCIATLGLILGTPLVERLLTRVPEGAGLRTVLATTLATQCAVLPLLAYHIGAVSLVAPVVNILVVPLIPFVMALGFVTGVVGIVLPVAAGVFGWATHLLTSYVFGVVSLFSSFPYAAVELPPMAAWVVVLTYGVLGIGVQRFYKNHPFSFENGWLRGVVSVDATPPLQTVRR